MNYYLVDFENVKIDGLKDMKGIGKGDSMIIFYSENCKSITLDVIDSIMALKLDYSSFKVKVGSKNALDFQLTSYLGYLIGKYGSGAVYHIVSEDKGFAYVADFWKEQNINVDCISLRNPAPAKKKEPVKTESKKAETKNTAPEKKINKIPNENLATLDEITALIEKKNQPEAVLKIINQYKSKTAINNALVKLFKDTKKAGEIYKMLKPLLQSKNKS